MHLTLNTFDIRQIRRGTQTGLDAGTLLVDTQAITDLVLQDRRLESVEVLLAHPGEATRIIHIMDVVEPRCKVTGAGSSFPGLLGPPQTTGGGVTHRLRGVAVVEAGEPASGEPIWWREAIVDMSGSNAQLSPFGKTSNVVLEIRPRPGVSYGDYNLAVRLAGLRVAEYLAAATRTLRPTDCATFELTPARSGLPRIVYIYQIYTPYLYGHVDTELLATLLHPNEILDGAVINSRNGPASTRPVTYLDQNNAVITELYAGHNVEWDFVGVIAYSGHDTTLSIKERGAAHAAKLAKLLRADGVILTYPSGGHPVLNIMTVLRECERLGIKTTLIMNEMAATPEDSGFVYYVPEATAIVNTGNFEETVRLPAVERVLGGSRLLEGDLPAGEEGEVSVRQILGATNQFGYSRLRAIRY